MFIKERKHDAAVVNRTVGDPKPLVELGVIHIFKYSVSQIETSKVILMQCNFPSNMEYLTVYTDINEPHEPGWSPPCT